MIKEKITVGIPEAKQITLADVIQSLEGLQQLTSEDAATFRKALDRTGETPEFVSHTKELLETAIHECNCLTVVIDKLKWELEWEL
jgi:hypothetical protein